MTGFIIHASFRFSQSFISRDKQETTPEDNPQRPHQQGLSLNKGCLSITVAWRRFKVYQAKSIKAETQITPEKVLSMVTFWINASAIK
jgi:hypothetical protein